MSTTTPKTPRAASNRLASKRPPARTPTGRPSRRHGTVKSAETHDAIIKATVRCFHRDGYFKTNMSTVAKEAGVTRGCMQYYFPTTESLLETAAEYLIDTLSDEHSARVLNPSAGKDRLEYAIDHFLAGRGSPHFQVLVEMLAAARTEPALRPILTKAMRRFEKTRLEMSEILFGDAAKAHQDGYRAAADLVISLSFGLTLYIFPDNAERRHAHLTEAVKDEVFRLWERKRARAETPVKRARRPA